MNFYDARTGGERQVRGSSALLKNDELRAVNADHGRLPSLRFGIEMLVPMQKEAWPGVVDILDEAFKAQVYIVFPVVNTAG